MKRTIISLLAWIIPISLTIYLFILQRKEREPVYAVKNEANLIYDKNNSSSRLKIYLDDSIPIINNIYVTNLVIWNRGKLPIEKKDVRKDIEIYPLDSTSILDYKIVDETHSGISNFKLDKIDNRLKLDWDYFDPSFGLEIQLIYTSVDKKERVKVSGYVLGNSVNQVIKREKSHLGENLTFLISAIMTIILLPILWINHIRKKTLTKNFFSLLGISLSLIGALVAYYTLIVKFTLFGTQLPL